MSQLAKDIAAVILKDATSRRGWRQEYEEFDAAVRREMRKTWERLIDEELADAGFRE